MLTVKALAGFLNLFVIIGAALFLPAWSLDYPEAWGFLAAFFLPVLLITLYFLKKDPDLIGRRLKAGPVAEERTGQKIVQSLASLFFVSMFIVSGLDHRLHWSFVPTAVWMAADLGVVLGLMIVFYVFRENTFTSAVIEVAENQKVISTGPYGIVRHPMYSGALLMLFSTPIALGSWWAMLFNIPMFAVIVARLLDEERVLLENLPGYEEYCRKTPRRLVPQVW